MAIEKNESGMYEATIDDQRYEFEKWGADDAMDALLDIAALLGKPIGLGLSAMFKKDDESGEKKNLLEKDFNPDVIAQVMEALTDRVSANKAMCKGLIKKLSSDKVFCEGKKVTFNSHYQDRLDHLFRVVQTALEVQYGNFFAAFLGASGVKVPTAVKGMMNRGPQP